MRQRRENDAGASHRADEAVTMKRFVILAVMLAATFAAPRVHADVTAPDSWQSSCAAGIKRALAADSAFASATVSSYDDSVDVMSSDIMFSLHVSNETEYPESVEWTDEIRLGMHCGGDEKKCTYPSAVMRAPGGYGEAFGRGLAAFKMLTRSAVRSCLDGMRRLVESPTYSRWRQDCADRLHAALARAAATDPFFANATITLFLEGIGIRLVGPERASARLARDVPDSRSWIDAWQSAIGDCEDAQTACELLRAPGYVGYVVSAKTHRRGFVEEIRPALRACMTPSSSR
jgi:hypothetical protein